MVSFYVGVSLKMPKIRMKIVRCACIALAWLNLSDETNNKAASTLASFVARGVSAKVTR